MGAGDDADSSERQPRGGTQPLASRTSAVGGGTTLFETASTSTLLQGGDSTLPVTNVTSMRGRTAYFDNAKFFLLCCVFCGHVVEPFVETDPVMKGIRVFFYCFHMPMFCLISGYFTKGALNPKRMKSLIERLAVPFVIFEILLYIFDHFITHSEEVHIQLFYPYWGLWYLLALFSWRVILPFYVQFRYPVATAVVCGVLSGYTDASHFFTLARTLGLFPFFLGGHYLTAEHFDKLRTTKVRILGAAILSVTFVASLSLANSVNLEWLYLRANFREYGDTHWYAGVARIVFYPVAAICGAAFLSLVPLSSGVYTAWGERSLYAYIWHIFVYNGLHESGAFHGVTGWWQKLLLFPAAIMLCCVLCTRLVQLLTWPLVEPKLAWLFASDQPTQTSPSSPPRGYGSITRHTVATSPFRDMGSSPSAAVAQGEASTLLPSTSHGISFEI